MFTLIIPQTSAFLIFFMVFHILLLSVLILLRCGVKIFYNPMVLPPFLTAKITGCCSKFKFYILKNDTQIVIIFHPDSVFFFSRDLFTQKGI